MNPKEILASIDEEIARLEQVKALLTANTSASKSAAAKRGPKPGTKRQLSPEARQRIAEAQKRRWAKQKKTQK